MWTWKERISGGILFIRGISAALTLFMLSWTAAAGELPFAKPVDNIPASVYGGNKRVWDLEFGDNGVLFVAASEWLCIWDGMEWHSLKAWSCLRDLHWDRQSGRLYAAGDNFFGYWKLDRYGVLQFTFLYRNNDNRRFQNFWRIIPKGDTLYVQTHEDIFAFDMETNEVGDAVASGCVGYIFDGGDVIWGQVDGVLYSYSGGSAAETGIVDADRIVAVRKDGEDLMYITELGGIKRFHGGSSVTEFPHLNYILKDDRIFSAKMNDDGSFLLGTVLNGVYSVGGNGKVMEHYGEADGVEYSTVLCLEEDSSGSLWLGLDGGLAYVDSDKSVTAYVSRTRNIGDVYSSMLHDGILYLGTNKGLFYVDGNMEPRQVPGLKGIVWNIVDCMEFFAVEMDGDLYVLYPDGRLELVLPKVWRFMEWKGVENLYCCSDHDGIVLLEKAGGTLAVRNRLENCDGYSSVPLRYDELGNLWVEGLWGGAQRLSLSQDRRKILSDAFYPVGNPKAMTLSHNVDGRLVFTQECGCYLYNLDEDKMEYSRYYSDICGSIDRNVHSLYQKGDFYFVYGSDRVGVSERHGCSVSYIASVSMKYDKYDFSENFSRFMDLNDSLVAIGCNNGIVLYNVKAPSPQNPDSLSLLQIRYDVEGNTCMMPLDADAVPEFPFGAANIALQLAGLPHNKTVYYSVDGNEKMLMRYHSYILIPYLPGGRHHVELYDSFGSSLLQVDMKMKHHWLLSWWFIVLTVLTLSALSVLMFTVSRRRTEALKRKYADKQAEMMEKERIERENEKLQMELMERNAKLTSMAINDMTVNNMLKEIEDELGKVAGDSKEMRAAVRPVRKVVERYFRENGSWEAFQTYFNGVYDGFFDRLKARYPQLTPNEVKICSYIKLGMSTKEIASLMNIETISAESARYRLRKNMGLAKGDSLSDVISGI